jgi:beta-N-acetylhexosaminidase
MVLVCNQPQQAGRVVESLSAYHNPAAQLRLARLHGRHFPERDKLRHASRWNSAVAALERIESERWLDMDLE